MPSGNFEQDFKDWQAQRGTFGWCTNVGRLLRRYPQQAERFVEKAGLGPDNANIDQHDDIAQALLYELSGPVNAIWNQDECTAWTRAGQALMGALLDFGHHSTPLLAKLILHEENGYVELGNQIGFCVRHLPGEYETGPLFQALLPNVLQRTAEVTDDPQVGNPWLGYDALVALGQRAKTLAPQDSWLTSWVDSCVYNSVMNTDTAGRLLAPLIGMGLDIDARNNQGLTLLETRVQPPNYTGTAWEQTIVLTLLTHGADGTGLSRLAIPPDLQELIDRHPFGRRTRLNDVVRGQRDQEPRTPRPRGKM